MIQFDAALAGVVATILIALMALAYGYGSVDREVKRIRTDTDSETKDRKEVIAQIRAEFKSYQIDNKGDHSLIFAKLDKIIENGSKKG